MGGEAGHRQRQVDLRLLLGGEGADVGDEAVALAPDRGEARARGGGGHVGEQLGRGGAVEARAPADHQSHRLRRVEGAVVVDDRLAGHLGDHRRVAGFVQARDPVDDLLGVAGDRHLIEEQFGEFLGGAFGHAAQHGEHLVGLVALGQLLAVPGRRPMKSPPVSVVSV